MTQPLFIDKDYTYALIGASHNPEKYGYKVFADLVGAGYTVIPVNPKGGTLLGCDVVPSLDMIEEHVDVVIFVVPPKITQHVLQTVIACHIDKVWFQPGSESDAALTLCREHDIAFVAHACMMVMRPHE